MADEENVPASLLIAASFSTSCVLLLVGHVLRIHLYVLRRLYLPASLIGGVIGLTVVQLLSIDDAVAAKLHGEWLAGWHEVPNFLISIVFSCLFLGERIPGVKEVWKISGPQLMYGQVLAWGQYAIPGLVCAAALIPGLDVNPLIAPTVALGFEGGHGTAAGVKATFQQLGYPEGANLTLCAATIGLLSGVLCGTLVINWGIRKGLVTTVSSGSDGPRFTGVYKEEDRPIAGHQTVAVDAVDSLALHMGVVGIAVCIGYILKRCLLLVEEQSEWLTEYGFFSAFPMFPFCMLGGILLQLGFDRFSRPCPVDRETIDRISGLALEFTIVTAIVTMDFSGMEDSLAAFIILIIVTWLWHLVCFFVLAKRLLPDFWVQRAVAEMGQSMGVTATGLLLLRMSDPHHKSPALVAFSYKQLLHEPIVGGGLWTASVLPFIAAAGIWPAVGTAWGALAFWAVVYFAYFRPRFKLGRAKGQKEGVAGDFGPVKGDHDKHMSNEESPLLLVSTAESAA